MLSLRALLHCVLATSIALPGVYAAPLADPVGLEKLTVRLSVKEGLLTRKIPEGRIVFLVAPKGTDPLEDTDVSSSPNKFFGKSVYNFGGQDVASLFGGSSDSNSTSTGVYGYPIVNMDDIPAGDYRVQAFLNRYETATRSDGSVVNVNFPCGDGAPNLEAFGSLTTVATDITITGSKQTVDLSFTNVTPVDPFTGKEIGGCAQGNYEDTATLKHLKIRSRKLSQFWGRDMYVGANIVLPAGYDANDKRTRYPVLYSQGHWPAGRGPFRYGTDKAFTAAWDSGIIPARNGSSARPAPKMILVTFRHEAPFYDDSYAVNTANMGPYGDAINDELIPLIDQTFNTIAEPYARIQEGGSTGGWISIASVIYRPDLFGVCFSSYPDSLDFHKHQAIELYTAKNAYTRADGSSVPSVRTFQNATEVVTATTAQENHWELCHGLGSRSSLQWDAWNAVFGVQGYNNYPLEPWDKVTGEIYPEAVEAWKPFDLSDYVVTNFHKGKKLGDALRERLFVYVGTWDNYYLNLGVAEFQSRTDAVGGKGWANVTITPEKKHGGNFQTRETWDFLELAMAWVKEHSPEGKSPLSPRQTGKGLRGNVWEEVIKTGGRAAAVARQAKPEVRKAPKGGKGKSCPGRSLSVEASVGRWDPGVVLTAQWVINGKKGDVISVKQGEVLKYTGSKTTTSVQLEVTGSKRGYTTETRRSNVLEREG